MSIFSAIVAAVLGHPAAAAPGADAPSTPAEHGGTVPDELKHH